VYLVPKGGLAAQAAAIAAVSTPGSAQYRHFLTSAQYQARYEPATATVAAVSAWLHRGWATGHRCRIRTSLSHGAR
jgi:hypothetical protein